MSENEIIDSNCKNIIIKIILIGSAGSGKKSFIKRANGMKCSSSEPLRYAYLKDKSSNMIKYNFPNTKISFLFLIPSEPEQYNGEENELSSSDDDQEIRDEYRIKFTSTKKDIKNFLLLFPNSRNLTTLEVFTFLYDLSNFETSFEELSLIYKSINKKFKINENFPSIILGTKIDKKRQPSDEKIKELNDFLSNFSNMKHFEIGTRINFDFVHFFSNLVKILLNEVGTISTNIIDQICEKIEQKQQFSKAPKFEKDPENASPGPAKYLNNIYDTENIEERINALIGENRFNTKLFINKKGPQMHKEHIKNKKEDPFDKYRNQYELSKAKKFQEVAQYLIGPKRGFSFNGDGHDSGKGGKLLAERKKKADERNELYYSAFRNNMIFGKQKKNQRYNSSVSLTTNNNEENKLNRYNNQSLSSARLMMSNNEEKYKNLVKENKSKIFQDQNYKKQIILEKYRIEYNDEERSKMRERYKEIIFGKNSMLLKKTDDKIEELRLKKEQDKEKEEIPMYDVSRGLLNEKKGFTMLSRRVPIDLSVNEAPYVYLKSDFDKCVERYKTDNTGRSHNRSRELK